MLSSYQAPKHAAIWEVYDTTHHCIAQTRARFIKSTWMRFGRVARCIFGTKLMKFSRGLGKVRLQIATVTQTMCVACPYPYFRGRCIRLSKQAKSAGRSLILRKYI